MMAYPCKIAVILLVISAMSFCQEKRIYNISVGSGPGSLSEYLHSGKHVFSSYTTMVFSQGVHYICEENMVTINNVTNFAMLGSTFTTVKSVPVGDGEEAKITEPSTIIDCQGCPTGFQFTNISELSVKRITFS